MISVAARSACYECCKKANALSEQSTQGVAADVTD